MARTCPRCTRSMEEGFILDVSDSGVKGTSKWHEGKPNRRWWGIKTSKAATREVSTWRCTGCGFLESYAP